MTQQMAHQMTQQSAAGEGSTLQQFIEARGLTFMNRPTRSKLYLLAILLVGGHTGVGSFRRRGSGLIVDVPVPTFPVEALESVAAEMGLVCA